MRSTANWAEMLLLIRHAKGPRSCQFYWQERFNFVCVFSLSSRGNILYNSSRKRAWEWW